MIELDEAVQLAKAQSKKVIEELGEEHQPMVIAFNSRGVSLIPIPLTELTKNIFRETVSKILRHLDAYAYIFICEAWKSIALIPGSSLTSRLMNGEVKVSELPPDDRVEILTITAVENGKSHRSWMAKIKYTTENKRYLDKWEELEGVGEGRMVLKEW